MVPSLREFVARDLEISMELLAMMQAQGNMVRLTHGAGRGCVRGQIPGHADEHVAPCISAAPRLILPECGVDDLERMKPCILPQHRMAKGG
jgi:hypothetical protein